MLLKKKVALLASMLVLNSWASSVLAGDATATLTVQANLVPTSCEVKINEAGSGVLDFKDVAPGVEKTSDTTLKINCTNRTRASISVTDDGKADDSTTTDTQFVLFDTENKQRGYFSIQPGNPVVDGENKSDRVLITSKDGDLNSRNPVWSTLSESPYLHPRGKNVANKYLSLGYYKPSSGSLGVSLASFKNLEIPLKVRLMVNKNDNFKYDGVIKGKATFYVKYI